MSMDELRNMWMKEALQRLSQDKEDLEKENRFLRNQVQLLSMQLAKLSSGWIDTADYLPSDLGEVNRVRLDPDVFLVWVQDAIEAAPATFNVEQQKFQPLLQDAIFGKPIMCWRYLPAGPGKKDDPLPVASDNPLAGVMSKVDPKLYMEQKAWLYRQICELAPSGEEAIAQPEGILHLMDELQDAAEEMGLAEFPQ